MLRGSESTVLTADFGPSTESNPWTDLKKIVTVNYIREMTCCANLGANPSTGGEGASGQINEI